MKISITSNPGAYKAECGIASSYGNRLYLGGIVTSGRSRRQDLLHSFVLVETMTFFV